MFLIVSVPLKFETRDYRSLCFHLIYNIQTLQLFPVGITNLQLQKSLIKGLKIRNNHACVIIKTWVVPRMKILF